MKTDKIKNMEEFARVSGVSRPTLSKFFHDPKSVRASTRDRIEAALQQYDYRPNIFAMNQNRPLTKTIGIVVPYLADPFFAEMVRKLEARCIEGGFWPILFSSHGKRELEVNALSTLQSLRPAGALIAPLGRASDLEVLERFSSDVPTIHFDSNVGLGSAFVGSNNRQSIDLIVEYLCRSGEPPCFLEMPPVNPNANKRHAAYIEAMERLGHCPEIVGVSQGGWEFEEIGLSEGKKLFAQKRFPSKTILCSNDRIAIGLIAAAFQQGLKVGLGDECDFRIAGHDDHPWARFTTPSLTTVSQDYESIVDLSAEKLFGLIENGSLDTDQAETLFEGRLVMRASA